MIDRGRDDGIKIAPPSEPDRRFSRIRLSSLIGSTVRLACRIGPLVPVPSDLASLMASRLASLPCRIVFTCVADWLSRTRLLQTPLLSDALTLYFLFFHGLTMQLFQLL